MDIIFATPTEYYAAITSAKQADTDNVLATVDAYDVDHYEKQFQDGYRFVTDKDGTAGAYVGPDGYMGGLFKNPFANVKGVAKALQDFRAENGGAWFDSYDGYLTKIYKSNNFVPVAKLAFNAEYAPDGWQTNDALKNSPDVLFWVKRELAHNIDEPVSVETYEQGQNTVKKLVS